MTNIRPTPQGTTTMRRKPIQSYDDFIKELRAKSVADAIETQRKLQKSLSTVDSETAGFGEFCVVSLFIIGGLIAGAYIMGLI